jgi:hypothetical protein
VCVSIEHPADHAVKGVYIPVAVAALLPRLGNQKQQQRLFKGVNISILHNETSPDVIS